MVANILISDTSTSTTCLEDSEGVISRYQKPSPTIYGLWRCSTDLQDNERQVHALKNAGAQKIYGDKITGTSDFHARPELTKCLDAMQSGDVLIISELSRLSRSFLGMVNEVSKLLERVIEI